MKYLKNIEDGSIQAVEEGSPAEATLKALRTTPDSTKSAGYPLYEEVAGPGTPPVDLSGIPTWVADEFGEGALVKHTGKLYIATGDVAADADAPDTNPTDWALIGPAPQAAFVDPATATTEDVAQALIDAGLMAAA